MDSSRLDEKITGMNGSSIGSGSVHKHWQIRKRFGNIDLLAEWGLGRQTVQGMMRHNKTGNKGVGSGSLFVGGKPME